jgi:polyisoprenyl-teichoic acid--peptidoglycan teichoic acid transferase
VAITAALYLRTDAVDAAIKNDEILKSLFIIESEGKPILTEVLFYYPPTRRAALFDIPAETGLIISSLKRVDRISILFKPKHPEAYRQEIAKLLSTEIPLSFVISLKGLGEMVDLLDGIEVFIPNSIDLDAQGENVLFPQGATILDGDKAKTYITYADPNEAENDLVARRQKTFLALLGRIAERSAYLSKAPVLAQFDARLQDNVSRPAIKRLIAAFAGLDAERIVPSRIQGTTRDVEGQSLLFPHYDGELLKDIVRQNLNALVNSSGSGEGDRIFTLEIRNGTTVKGLAKKAAALYQSFGYEVMTVDNAEREDIALTSLIDRFGNPDVAKNVGQVIRCAKITGPDAAAGIVSAAQAAEGGADFILVLGKDFNGRYCAP